jgi:hypothetical protein
MTPFFIYNFANRGKSKHKRIQFFESGKKRLNPNSKTKVSII